jgi:hypothetical protein
MSPEESATSPLKNEMKQISIFNGKKIEKTIISSSEKSYRQNDYNFSWTDFPNLVFFERSR